MTIRASPQRGLKEAFTLSEVLLAVVIIGLLFGANVSAIYLSRMTGYRDQDRGIVADFMVHYLELVRALPFDQVAGGNAISGLFNGSNGTPVIRIPLSTNWFAINNTNYTVFHPDLVWLTNRAPEMRLVLTTTMSGGLAHTKHLCLEARWRPPLGSGALMSNRFDMIRVKDQ